MLVAVRLIALDKLPYNAHGFDMMNIKFLVKLPLAGWTSLVVIKEQAKKKKLYHFYAHIVINAERDITYGIRAKRLKRSDLMDTSTYRYDVSYVNYTM